MPISATSKDTGVSVRKVKPIADLIRGKSVGDALEVLDFFPISCGCSCGQSGSFGYRKC